MSKELERSILNHFFQIGQHMRQHHHGAFGSADLTMHQMRALFFIKHEQPVRMSQLADHLGITPGSATLLADRLVEAGWAARVPDPADRRTTYLELSPDTKQKFDRLANERLEQAGRILEKLSADDLRELDRILGVLQESITS